MDKAARISKKRREREGEKKRTKGKATVEKDGLFKETREEGTT